MPRRPLPHQVYVRRRIAAIAAVVVFGLIVGIAVAGGGISP